MQIAAIKNDEDDLLEMKELECMSLRVDGCEGPEQYLWIQEVHEFM